MSLLPTALFTLKENEGGEAYSSIFGEEIIIFKFRLEDGVI